MTSERVVEYESRNDYSKISRGWAGDVRQLHDAGCSFGSKPIIEFGGFSGEGS
jgi:hypothetical protein